MNNRFPLLAVETPDAVMDFFKFRVSACRRIVAENGFSAFQVPVSGDAIKTTESYQVIKISWTGSFFGLPGMNGTGTFPEKFCDFGYGVSSHFSGSTCPSLLVFHIPLSWKCTSPFRLNWTGIDWRHESYE